MKTMQHSGATEVVIIALEPGEFLLESIREAVRGRGIKSGAVVSGIGTLKTCRMHYINHVSFPPADTIFSLEKPLELLSINGLIADGEPHLHIVVSCGSNEVYAGHLEEGSEVAYLAEIAVLAFNDLAMARHLDPQRRIRLLGPKEG
jgi:predicted DNA-binding protein with PD1-like motif